MFLYLSHPPSYFLLPISVISYETFNQHVYANAVELLLDLLASHPVSHYICDFALCCVFKIHHCVASGPLFLTLPVVCVHHILPDTL